VWALFVAGCGGDDTTGPTPGPTDSGSDAKKDTGADVLTDKGNVLPDVKSDGDAAVTPNSDATDGDANVVTPDADTGAPEVRPDVVPDAPSDRVEASLPDVQPDRGPDVVPT